MEQKRLISINENAANIICNSIFANSSDYVYFLIGAEVEFYLSYNEQISKIDHPIVLELFEKIKTIGHSSNVLIDKIEIEDGENQFEIQTLPTDNPIDLANFLTNLQEPNFCQKNHINLCAKPLLNQPSSGMHFHFSLYDCNDVNLFGPIAAVTSEYQKALYNAIAGLLFHNNSLMPIYSPTDNCYKRYRPPMKGQIFKHNPTNCSWGINNRTCAIRIPQSSTIAPSETRIEHRVCSPIANPYDAIGAMLYSIADGIAQNRQPPSPIFGDAYDPIYFDITPRFPASLSEAITFAGQQLTLTNLYEKMLTISTQFAPK